MKSGRAWADLWAAGVLLAAGLGCAPAFENSRPLDREAVYQRADLQFTNAILFKPRETDQTSALGSKLAPLFLQEVLATSAREHSVSVFFAEDQVLLHGRSHDQVTYWWPADAFAGAGREGEATQAVRITLNAAGFPVIWEILADDSGAELIFVSRSLEDSALGVFGPPLAGRRFAVERPLNEAPKVIVARVIDDGPMPMGPILHLNAHPPNVSTLVCRCMPAQARNLLATQTYELRPGWESKGRPAFGPTNGAARLEQSLRLPQSF